MPNNIANAAPTDVLPAGLAAAFTEEIRFECFLNGYLDGSSDRLALSLNPRRFFKQTRRLTAAQYAEFWTFYQTHLVSPFYFYFGPETTPPWHTDPTGSDPVGRYTCVFDGSWSDGIGLSRSQASFGMREVG